MRGFCVAHLLHVGSRRGKMRSAEIASHCQGGTEQRATANSAPDLSDGGGRVLIVLNHLCR